MYVYLFRYIPIFGFCIICIGLSFFSFRPSDERRQLMDSLRTTYLQDSKHWPKANVDPGIVFEELGQLPASPYNVDSLKPLIALGRILFHDPRLSGSNQISCGSCHASDLTWTDGRRISLGHNHTTTNRNTPSIENVWRQNIFFWDGRANTLEEQALEAIKGATEMNQNPEEIPQKLSTIKGYLPLFNQAFGDNEITMDRVLSAIAMFQRTITSRKSKFDNFLMGDSRALTDQQVLGLHLFRTKARCINCHNGPFFSDQQFHNLGMTHYKDEQYEDLGRYEVTKGPEDVGKFKTASLRNVMRTGPWFHNGLFDDIEFVLARYNVGMPSIQPQDDTERNDPLFPKSSPILQVLGLTVEERNAIIAFLESLSSPPRRMDQPVLPQ